MAAERVAVPTKVPDGIEDLRSDDRALTECSSYYEIALMTSAHLCAAVTSSTRSLMLIVMARRVRGRSSASA